MIQDASNSRVSKFQRIGVVGAIALVAVVLFVSLVVLKPAEPDRIQLLTGPEETAYHQLGKRYAAELKHLGLETEIVLTAGGVDNLDRLANGDEDSTVALVPSNAEMGLEPSVDISSLASLGSVAFEPLWLFLGPDQEVHTISDLAGKTVLIGGPGSVSEYLARMLAESNGIEGQVEFTTSTQQTADGIVLALRDGEADAAFATGPANSSVIKTLLDADDVVLFSFERADAYTALFPGVARLEAPEGVFDLSRNIPPAKTFLLAATTNLVATDDLHPSVVPLMLRAAAEVHVASVFTSQAQFPNQENVSLPLKHAACRYYEQGEVGLSKFLPHTIVRRLNHIGFVVLPLLTIVLLLVKILPALLRTVVSIRLTKGFKRLESLEKETASGGDREETLDKLNQLDRDTATMFVPRSKVQDYVDFRQFIHDMRDRLANSAS